MCKSAENLHILKTNPEPQEAIIAKLLKPNDRSFTAKEVRLIGAEGEQLNIVSLETAREMAKEAGLDLVIVADKADIEQNSRVFSL